MLRGTGLDEGYEINRKQINRLIFYNGDCYAWNDGLYIETGPNIHIYYVASFFKLWRSKQC